MKYLLLDVDGVINQFGYKLSDNEDEYDTVFIAQDYRIHVPLGTRKWVKELEEIYTFVWATTWEEMAPNLLSKNLGFGRDWPVIYFTEGNLMKPTWKLPSVEKWIDRTKEDGDIFAWVDDDFQEDATDWWLDREDKDDILLLKTNPIQGWRQSHIDILKAFADGIEVIR